MAKDHPHTDMTPGEVEDRIWELAKKIDVCMFVTWDGERQRARPLSARVHREEHAIYFLVDVEGDKNEQVEEFPIVTITWTDNSGYKYVSMTGKAAITNDRAKIRELWEKTDKAWWEDENDPAIRLLTVNPDDAELWDSPGKLIATGKMIFAAVTGGEPDLGDNAKTTL